MVPVVEWRDSSGLEEQARGGVCVQQPAPVGGYTAKNGHGLAIRRCCTASCLGDGRAVRCYDCEWWRRDGMGWPVVGFPASGLARQARAAMEQTSESVVGRLLIGAT